MSFRLGCCGCMTAGGTDGTGIHVLDDLAALGYDYIELSLRDLMALDNDVFDALHARLDAAPIGCETCHNFFPDAMRLTGESADHATALAYAERAVARAGSLGAKAIVFGSSGAKNVPEGFPMDRAWQQIVDLLRAIDPFARRAGLDIVIEPLNRRESNIVNSVAEGRKLTDDAGCANIRLLADYYHVMLENEPMTHIAEAADCLRHVHFAEIEGRRYPKARSDDYVTFFRTLAGAGYRGRVSVEAFSDDFAADARRARDILRPIFAETTAT